MDGLVLDLSDSADAPLAFDAQGDATMGQRGLGPGGQEEAGYSFRSGENGKYLLRRRTRPVKSNVEGFASAQLDAI